MGTDHALALLSNGTVDTWPDPGSPPVAVAGLTGVTAVSAGNISDCALLSNGSVECWGDNTYGELGDGTTTSSTTPVAVTGLTGVTAISVSGGTTPFACALLSNGTVKCWGASSYGELGNGTTTGPETCNGHPCSTTPVTSLSGATAISAGAVDVCTLLSNGRVDCWGDDSDGQLGPGTTSKSSSPVAVAGLTGATAISLGLYSACALLSGGSVECWGNNDMGQLGTGSAAYSTSALGAVSGVTGVTAISDGGDGDTACALLSNGTVKCWGDGLFGQLGNGMMTNSSTPVAVTGLTGVTAISAGGGSNAFACALLSGGTVDCWGASNSTPVAVTGF